MGVARLKSAGREAALRQGAAVIGLAGVVSRDRHFLARHFQFAVHRRHAVVAHNRLDARRHCNAVNRRDYVGLRAHVRDRAASGHRHREGVCVARLKSAGREAALRQGAAVIGLAGVVRRDRHSLALNRQHTAHIRDIIVVSVATDLGRARNDHAIIHADICFHTRQRDARQSIAALQAVNRHVGVESTRVCAGWTLLTTVVGVGLGDCRDRQRGLFDCQVAVDIVDRVVACVAANLGIARHDNSRIGTGVCFLAGQSDARQSVAALQALNRHVGVEVTRVCAGRTLGLAGVCIGLRFRRNRQSRRLDLQPTVRI